MKELNKQEFLSTMGTKMARFQLTDASDIDAILAITRELFDEHKIIYQKLELEYCYENNLGIYSHFLVNWGKQDQYLILISDDEREEWYGYYLMDFKEEYGVDRWGGT